MRMEAHLRKLIENGFLVLCGGSSIEFDISLLETGLLDATALFELADFVGERFSIHVEDGDIIWENFDSINRIAMFIRKKRSQVPIGIKL